MFAFHMYQYVISLCQPGAQRCQCGGTPTKAVLVHLSLPASAYSYRRGCGFWRGRERSGVGLSYHDGLSLLGVQLWHRPAEAFGCRGGDVGGWHLCSSTSSALRFPAPCQLFIGQGWRQRVFQIFSPPRHLPIITSLLSPPRAERRRGREGEKRFCPIKSNRYKDCRHPAFADQTLPPPVCLYPKDFYSVFSFPSSWWSSFSCRVAVQHVCFPRFGAAWKDFDLWKDEIKEIQPSLALFSPCLPCHWGSKGIGK